MRTQALLAATIFTCALAQPAPAQEAELNRDPAAKAELNAQRPLRNPDIPDWPAYNDPSRLFATNNLQGRPLPETLADLTERVNWLNGKPDTEGKVVVIEFWATWCAPCKASRTRLEALEKAYGDVLDVLLISGDAGDSEELIAATIADGNTLVTHAWDPTNTFYRRVGAQAIPHVLVVSSDGIVRWQGFPLDRAFLPTVNRVLIADPVAGEKLRRKAAEAPITDDQLAEVKRKALEHVRQMREQQEQRAQEQNPEPTPTEPKPEADEE